MGAYAIAVLDKNDPDTIVCGRQSSPLVIGVGDNEYFLASDASPFVEYTKRSGLSSKDGEVAEIRRGEPIKVTDLNNVESDVDITTSRCRYRSLKGRVSALYAQGNLRAVFHTA